MEAGSEELKILQTAILLITTNSVVQHEALAKVKTIVTTVTCDIRWRSAVEPV